MLTGVQVREARALLGWSRGDLSRRGTLSLNMICRAEASDGEAGITLGHRIVMRAAFEKAGVVFAVEVGNATTKLHEPACAGRGTLTHHDPEGAN